MFHVRYLIQYQRLTPENGGAWSTHVGEEVEAYNIWRVRRNVDIPTLQSDLTVATFCGSTLRLAKQVGRVNHNAGVVQVVHIDHPEHDSDKSAKK